MEYISKKGAPENSWIATLSGEAIANSEVAFLGLELTGKLTVTSAASVSGRNELRISKGGKLVLEGGLLNSAQWLELKPGATLAGHGVVEGDLYTSGTLELDSAGLTIQGRANLGGTLRLHKVAETSSNRALPIVKAHSITGRFDNQTVAFGAKEYEISYSKTEVILTPK